MAFLLLPGFPGSTMAPPSKYISIHLTTQIEDNELELFIKFLEYILTVCTDGYYQLKFQFPTVTMRLLHYCNRNSICQIRHYEHKKGETSNWTITSASDQCCF